MSEQPKPPPLRQIRSGCLCDTCRGLVSEQSSNTHAHERASRMMREKVVVLLAFGPLGLAIGAALAGNIAGSGMLLIIQITVWSCFDFKGMDKSVDSGERRGP